MVIIIYKLLINILICMFKVFKLREFMDLKVGGYIGLKSDRIEN